MLFAFLGFMVNINAQENSASTSTTSSLLLSLMEDAEVEEYTYSVNSTIVSDYKVSSYRAHVYFAEEHEMLSLHENFQKSVSKLVNFDFKSPHLTKAYLVLEVKYGPNFLYDANATGLCIVPFDGVSVFNQIPCNTLVTAEYLIASAMHDSGERNIINANATKQYLDLQRLPNRKFWQDYLAVHQLVMSHLAEIEDYKLAHSGNYLSVSYRIIASMLSDVRKYRRLRVQNIDDAALKIDSTMVNFAYRLYMSIDGLLKRNVHLLPKVEESPSFIKDFFTGRIIFSLLTEEAAVAANLQQENDKLYFTYWPWFKYLTVRFDDRPELHTTDREITIPDGVSRVDLVGHGEKGRYAILRYTILPFTESTSGAHALEAKSLSALPSNTFIPSQLVHLIEYDNEER